MNIKKQIFSIIVLVTLSQLLKAEPFIKTDDVWLRADIEMLANIGAIKTPINTYPLTWGPILKDLSNLKVLEIPQAYRDSYFRVLRKGRLETRNKTSYSELFFSASQESELFRQFGDKARNDRELMTRTTGMSNNFAWNLEVSVAPSSGDGDDKRFDGSYFAGVGGNWVFSIGQIEKWWGPGMQHSIILSNNAKPISAFNLQRNYSERFNSAFLNWIGPWTFHAFAGLLDDERTIDNAKLVGMSYSFKPIDRLEIGLRRSAQWGGDGRPENFDSFLDLLVGIDNCDEGGLSCSDNSNEPGNQLAGIDVSWRNNWILPVNLYFQTVGEDEAGYAPSKKSWAYGANFHFLLFENPLFLNFEYVDTSVDGDGNTPGVPFEGFNILYEHSIYTSGYRYLGRTIGSTIDNDSKALGIVATYHTDELGELSFSALDVKLNIDSNNAAAPGGHSIVNEAVEFKELTLKWRYSTQELGTFLIRYNSRSERLTFKIGEFDSNSLSISWSKQF